MEFIYPDWPAPDRVRALVTTRGGGVSTGPYASLNLGDHCGDTAHSVLENRRLLCARTPAQPVWLRQVHGTAVLRLEGMSANQEADAAIATRPGLACAIMVADCLPILVASEDSRAVAGIHVGWRGLAAGVIENTLSQLGRARSLLAWLGPAISQEAYEVGAEVRAACLARDPRLEAAFAPSRPDHWKLDLYAAARRRLEECGVRTERIYGGGFCTYRDARRFFSYRRERVTGRIAALIWLD